MIQKSLTDWLEHISHTHPADIEMGLTRVKQVYSALALPTQSGKIVLVAGTNGKGSTIAMIETAMLALGYKVGAYTSPHILDYNERVRINGQAVSDEQLVQSFERVERARQSTPLTYFEFGTLAAFDLLMSAGLDVLLLEIGLGGRLDAVNVVQPDLSIITSIGLDHTELLGDTLDKIGTEKAGILRSGVPFIAGESMPQSVRHQAHSLACPVFFCREDFNKEPTGSVSLRVGDHNREFAALPQVRLPENNVLLALQAIAYLFGCLGDNSGVFDDKAFTTVMRAIEHVSIPGRLERIPVKQEVYLDVGHNPHAAVYLKAFLMHHAQQGKAIQLVYSSLQDKDVRAIAGILSVVTSRWLLAPLSNERAMTIGKLEAEVRSCSPCEVRSFSSVADAIQAALSSAGETETGKQAVLTLIFGSFYMVEAAKRFFKSYE